ncbi:hypothetical protein F0L74_18780 [Chitinophaga agrisoli]|uniref:Outer membrane protein with beta-barrel domain n=1 Tax=Chitinophaga agrisoli TaxID=2607653 RepID=A0A5B2VUN6_9BACT|nr:hypothetical protein [Chitinophaga agrisoli]KAA2241906.1 hypothetical protein F0L74_18780 [Chitinophaga agrisoli]
MKKLHVFLFLLLVAGSLQAQTDKKDAKKQEREQRKLKRISLFRELEEGENNYEREFSMGGRLNTDGWSGFLELGYRKNRKVVNYFQFEFAEKKDPKEDKKPGRFVPVGNFAYTEKPYIYGKQNNFYQAKLGVGQRYLIGGKGNKNGVEVNAIYYGGVSIGLLKPYYLKVQDPANDEERDVKYGTNPDLDSAFVDPSKIIAGAGFGKGWGEITVVPGLHAKAGLRFDWAKFNEVVSALEIGVNAEYYTKDVPILVDQTGKKFFFNAYLSLQFGKRWDRK